MITPTALYNFGKVCEDSAMVGNIVRKMCGQEVKLSTTEEVIYNMIANDNKWMDERIADKKVRVAERQRKLRERKREEQEKGDVQNDTESCKNEQLSPDMSRSVTLCHATKRDITPVTPCHATKRDTTHVTQDGVTQRVSRTNYLLTNSLTYSLTQDKCVCANAGAHTRTREGGQSQGEVRTRGDVPTLSEVVTVATTAMGVPDWYAAWWYREMNARDWTTTAGAHIGNTNWRPTLKSWYNRATEKERAQIEAEAKQARQKPKEPTAADWELCAERCANCKDGHCTAGITIPPQLAQPPYPPEECKKYASIEETSAQIGEIPT